MCVANFHVISCVPFFLTSFSHLICFSHLADVSRIVCSQLSRVRHLSQSPYRGSYVRFDDVRPPGWRSFAPSFARDLTEENVFLQITSIPSYNMSEIP